MFTVEKNVPLTEAKVKDALYPFAQMDVGDSFLIKPKATETMQTLTCRVHSFVARRKLSKRFNPTFKIAVRSGDEGLRVWRVN